MPMIREVIVTTIDQQGQVHIAPFGLTEQGEFWIIAPFRPSKTLDNLADVPVAVANYTDDVRIFAGCLTGRRDWPLTRLRIFPCRALPRRWRMPNSLSSGSKTILSARAFSAASKKSKSMRLFAASTAPKPQCSNSAILVSRLDMLPRERVEQEIDLSRNCDRQDRGAGGARSLGLADAEGFGFLCR